MKQNAVAIFGEVLFDVYGKKRLLGGAPFNAAWHLAHFGASPLLLTRIGQDRDAQEVRHRLAQAGMQASGIQEDPFYSTGVALVDESGPSPRFCLPYPQAWDRLSAWQCQEALLGFSPGLFCHGTLALRSPVSRRAFFEMASRLSCPRFVDVNLRSPWFSKEIILAALTGASWAKMNREELDILAQLFFPGHSGLHEQIQALMARFSLGGVLVTLGGEGAMVATLDETVRVRAFFSERAVDTVGCGDALFAVTILGMLLGWPLGLALERASLFAGKVAQIQGALPPGSLYGEMKRDWGLGG